MVVWNMAQASPQDAALQTELYALGLSSADGVRWVDARKADGTHRPCLVAKDISINQGPELFAAAPPIESLKYLLRRAAQDLRLNIMHMDVMQAYFFADASRDIYVQCSSKTSRAAMSRCAECSRNDVQHTTRRRIDSASVPRPCGKSDSSPGRYHRATCSTRIGKCAGECTWRDDFA